MTKVKKQQVKNTTTTSTQPPVSDNFANTEVWFRENRNIVLVIFGVIALAIAGIFAYKYFQKNQNEEAQRQMFQAVYYFEADSLNKALNGDGNNFGFLEIIEEFGITAAANLSHFYAGASFLKLGQYENAIEHLNDFSSDDLLLQARAYSLVGDAYMESGNFVDAAKHYQKAAVQEPNKFFTPRYLSKAALAFENSDDIDKAMAAYDKIIKQYKQSPEYPEAQKHKARLEAMTSK